MRFGNCLDLVAPANGGSRRILDLTVKAGFDFVEPSLMSLARASEAEFAAVQRLAGELSLCVPVCNGMFPADIRLTAHDVDYGKIAAYVEGAFARAKSLGVEKVVLGSDKSRQLPEGYDQDTAYAEMIDMVKQAIVPACEKYGITVMIEPLRVPCNFINTLADGMRVVNGVNHPRVQLLADTIHMITSGEDPACIQTFLPSIRHVHVSDWERRLPQFGYSPELTAVIRNLALSGYDITCSFEVKQSDDDLALQRALLLLKAALRH